MSTLPSLTGTWFLQKWPCAPVRNTKERSGAAFRAVRQGRGLFPPSCSHAWCPLCYPCRYPTGTSLGPSLRDEAHSASHLYITPFKKHINRKGGKKKQLAVYMLQLVCLGFICCASNTSSRKATLLGAGCLGMRSTKTAAVNLSCNSVVLQSMELC